MPLVRAEVRNEYALGAQELYGGAQNEDSREILEGVSVAGLVGVLRQLGDLTEFAAEVFHGFQEELMMMASRGHKLMGRVRRIETALSPLEKAVLAQRSHLHFAYAAGLNWHMHIQCQQNQIVCSDVPQFIMDSYEECRDPPCLQLLDRFDPGGPGSCLKRYSDPTFFKRASMASNEVNTGKVSKDRMGHRMKKRRPWCWNVEVSHDVSVFYSFGRAQLTHLNDAGHPSPTPTASTFRSELYEQSNKDLRSGSEYTECDSRPSYSVQTEELESRESFSSVTRKHNSDFLDYKILDKKITNAYDDIQVDLSQEQAVCCSSVTMDERGETLDHSVESDNDRMTQEDGHNNRPLEPFSPRMDIEAVGEGVVDFETEDKMDQFSDQAVPAQESSDVHLDGTKSCNEDVPTAGSTGVCVEDIESETDQYMDALNTIESEGETDVHFTRKVGVECCSEIESQGGLDMACELIGHNLECQSSITESNDLANSSPSNGSCGHYISLSPNSPYATNRLIDRLAGKGEIRLVSDVEATLSSQTAGESLTAGSPPSFDSHGNGSIDTGNNVESVSWTESSDFRDGTSDMPIIDKTNCCLESQKSPSDTSNVSSITFWTNGGLLGLQPSKPPDCSAMKGIPQNPVYNKEGKFRSSHQLENLKNREEGIDSYVSTFHEYQESSASFSNTSGKLSPADLDIKLGKLDYSLHQSNAGSTGSSVTAYGSFQPGKSALQAGKHQENSRGSSSIFELGSRLLPTGFNKRLSAGQDESSNCVDYQIVNALEQKNHQNVVDRTFCGRSNDLLCDESPILSPSSSPPLKHMQLSFQPVDGFETSHLKLKFPDVRANTRSDSDIFPSFQLVPDMSITPCNVGSDSDADIFDESTPSLSDDCRSNESESDFEQWESSEYPTRNDPELYDSLCVISLKESVSTAPQNGRASHRDIHDNCGLHFPYVENGLQISKSHLSDLRHVVSLNHSLQKDLRNGTNLKDTLEPRFEPFPVPPPSPPMHWRGMTPNLYGMEDKCEAMPEDSYCAFDCTHSSSPHSQPKLAPSNTDHIGTSTVQKSKSSLPKTNGQREADPGRSTNENDFLQQIRTKSFHLRPTSTAKPKAPPAASINVQITAILEKANTIRQAVTRDEEDDDGDWSDS